MKQTEKTAKWRYLVAVLIFCAVPALVLFVTGRLVAVAGGFAETEIRIIGYFVSAFLSYILIDLVTKKRSRVFCLVLFIIAAVACICLAFLTIGFGDLDTAGIVKMVALCLAYILGVVGFWKTHD